MRLAFVATLLAYLAQSPRDPTARSKPVEYAAISGVVVADTPAREPLSRVVVTAVSAEVSAGRSAVSDNQGRFLINNLPPGRFTVTAMKPAFLTGALGATRPGGLGVELIVGPGQRIDNLSLILTHGASVSGVVRDATGNPMTNVRIVAFRLKRNQTYVASTGTTSTDDRGNYRMFGLAPGQYLVGASATRELQLGSVVETPSLRQIDEVLARLERRQSSVSAGSTTPAAPVEAMPTLTPAPVFYPGTLDLSRAQRVSVSASEDVTGIDISFVEGRAANVEGVVILPDRLSSRLSVAMTLDGPFLPTLTSQPSLTLRPGANGRFRFGGVAPGQYVLQATALRSAAGTSGASSLMWARTDLNVAGSDLTGISLALQPAIKVQGRIAFSTPPVGRDPAVQIVLTDVSSFRALAMTGLMSPNVIESRVKNDGTFEIPDVVPGRYELRVKVDGWIASSAMLGDQEALDLPFEIREDASPLAIQLTNRPATLRGAVDVPRQYAPTSYYVVLFPRDGSLRRGARVHVTRLDTLGHFEFQNLAPGDYLAGVATDVDSDESINDALLTSLESASVRVLVTAGAETNLTLRIRSDYVQRKPVPDEPAKSAEGRTGRPR